MTCGDKGDDSDNSNVIDANKIVLAVTQLSMLFVWKFITDRNVILIYEISFSTLINTILDVFSKIFIINFTTISTIIIIVIIITIIIITIRMIVSAFCIETINRCNYFFSFGTSLMKKTLYCRSDSKMLTFHSRMFLLLLFFL